MNFSISSFYSFWNASPLEQDAGTTKISRRVIGGFNFQFRKLDYRAQTQLSLRVAGLAKYLEPLFRSAQVLRDPDTAKDQQEAQDIEDDNRSQMMTVLPELLGLLGNPEVELLLSDLVATARVDRGNGSFEELSNPVVGEAVFGPDITLQAPVAASVLEVNLAGFIKRVMDGFGSKT